VVAAFGLMRRSPGLAGLLAAQTISPLGDAMAMTALILHVQRTTGSATAVGLLLFAQAIPALAAPLAGVIADRFSPARLLAAGWLTQAALAGLVALLLPPLAALLVVVFVLALVGTPLSAAAGRCVPAVVADDDLVAANALRSAVGELGTVLGPPLAGFLFAVSGTRLVLGLDALTFLAVVPLALRLPALAQDTDGQARPSLVRDARDGLAFIRRTPYVLAVAVGFWVVVLFSAPDDLILPFLATVTFRAGPVAVGVLLAAASAGLLAGLPLTGPAGRRLGVTGAIMAGFAVMAAGNLLTAAAPWLMAAFAAQVLRGLAIPLADSHVTTYLQRTTPPPPGPYPRNHGP
jgi:MFS family permease